MSPLIDVSDISIDTSVSLHIKQNKTNKHDYTIKYKEIFFTVYSYILISLDIEIPRIR